MKSIIHSFAAMTLLTLVQPAAAECGLTAAPTPPGANAPVQARVAHELATLYYPEDMISAVVERQSRSGFEQGVRDQPGGEMILRDMPDVVDVGYAATMAIVRPCVVLLVPALQNDAAAVLGRRLSIAHMREVTAFYRSDSGRATMIAIIQTLRPAQPRMRADGSIEPMTRADIRAAVPANFLELLTPAQIAGLERFGTSAHGQAFLSATPELEQLTVGTVNRMNAAVQPQVETAVRAAVQDHMRRNPPARRGS